MRKKSSNEGPHLTWVTNVQSLGITVFELHLRICVFLTAGRAGEQVSNCGEAADKNQEKNFGLQSVEVPRAVLQTKKAGRWCIPASM